jgi:hypothetical protein
MVEARGRGGRAGTGASAPSGRDANGKVIPKPASWERAAKRSLIPAGLLLVFVLVMNHKNENPINVAVLTIAAFVFYVPISYAVDRWMYNSYVKKNGVPT